MKWARDDRPTIDTTMLDAAETFARRSTCSRLQVGAVLARDGRVLSTGYNGAPAGLPHCEHFDTEPCRNSVHAETNAVAFAARHGVSTVGATLYVTHEPCESCAGLLINAGIASVVYRDRYRSSAGVERLRSAGMLVCQEG